jgi:RNA polymerase sigma-70 factor (ECF subfamily)
VIYADAGPDSLEKLVGAEQIQALQKCLETLGKEERDSIWLAYWKGMTQMELAEFWEKPLGTIKTWVRRGLQQLRGCLEA